MKFAIRAGAMLGACALAAIPGYAQNRGEQLGAELLWLQQEDVVVTHDRAPRRIETIPSSITVITAEQIEGSGARQVPDVLRWYASVDTHDFFGNGMQSGVDVRAFGINADSSVLVLVDGRRINGITLFSTDWTTIPLERVARIEIVRGGNSVMYGSQAVGGVVNIITKRGTVDKQLTSGLEAGSFQYYKPYVNLSGTTLVGAGAMTWHLNASRSRLDGYRRNSGLDIDTIGASTNYESGPFAFDASLGHKDDRLGLPGAAPAANRRGSATPNDHSSNNDSYLRLVPSFRIAADHRVQLAVDHRRVVSDTETTFGGKAVGLQDHVTQTFVSPQYSGLLRPGGIPNRLVLGYDYQRSGVVRQGSFASMDNAVTARAFYVSDTAALLDGALSLDAGWRRETFAYSLTSPLARGDVSVHAAKLGATWNYQEGSKLFASLDRSYRLQLLDEPGTPAILRPQVARQLQLGAKHRFGKATEVRAAVFDIRTKDEIVLDAMTFENVNWPDTRRRGFELEGSATLGRGLTAFGSVSQQDSKTLAGTYTGKQIPLTWKGKGAVGLAWAPAPNWTLDGRVRWLHGKVMSGDFDNTGSWKSSYHVADLAVMYRDKRYTLAGGVLNATNQKYAEVGFSFGAFGTSIYPQPARSYYLSLAVTNLF